MVVVCSSLMDCWYYLARSIGLILFCFTGCKTKLEQSEDIKNVVYDASTQPTTKQFNASGILNAFIWSLESSEDCSRSSLTISIEGKSLISCDQLFFLKQSLIPTYFCSSFQDDSQTFGPSLFALTELCCLRFSISLPALHLKFAASRDCRRLREVSQSIHCKLVRLLQLTPQSLLKCCGPFNMSCELIQFKWLNRLIDF